MKSSYRVLRGGSWYFIPQDARPVRRDWCNVDYRSDYLGLRLARREP